MAPVPKKKHTRGRSGRRRQSIKLSMPGFVKCENCGKLRFPHTACGSCGYYKKSA